MRALEWYDQGEVMRGMVKQGVTGKMKDLTTQYIQLLSERRMAEAEKILEKIKNGLKDTPWHKGYYNALEGMAIALKSNDDRYLYMMRIDLENKKGVDRSQREFSKQSRSPLQDDFGRGYFTAWLEYIQAVKSLGNGTKSLNDYLSIR